MTFVLNEGGFKPSSDLVCKDQIGRNYCIHPNGRGEGAWVGHGELSAFNYNLKVDQEERPRELKRR